MNWFKSLKVYLAALVAFLALTFWTGSFSLSAFFLATVFLTAGLSSATAFFGAALVAFVLLTGSGSLLLLVTLDLGAAFSSTGVVTFLVALFFGASFSMLAWAAFLALATLIEMFKAFDLATNFLARFKTVVFVAPSFAFVAAFLAGAFLATVFFSSSDSVFFAFLALSSALSPTLNSLVSFYGIILVKFEFYNLNF